MIANNVKINKAFLESGNNFLVTQNIEVKHPSIDEILELGGGICCEDIYWVYVSALLCDPYDNMIWLDDNGIDYEKVTAFDVFIMKWQNAEKDYLENKEKYDQLKFTPSDHIKNALHFFIGKHNFALSYDNGIPFFYDIGHEDAQITDNVFSRIAAFIQLINGISNVNRINPANENAKKVLIEDKRDELKKQQRKDETLDSDYLGSMISAVVHGGNGGITPFNFKQLKMYQLYSSMSVEQKKSHYDNIMSGVYHGTVDFEKINKQEINWTG